MISASLILICLCHCLVFTLNECQVSIWIRSMFLFTVDVVIRVLFFLWTATSLNISNKITTNRAMSIIIKWVPFIAVSFIVIAVIQIKGWMLLISHILYILVIFQLSLTALYPTHSTLSYSSSGAWIRTLINLKIIIIKWTHLK